MFEWLKRKWLEIRLRRIRKLWISKGRVFDKYQLVLSRRRLLYGGSVMYRGACEFEARVWRVRDRRRYPRTVNNTKTGFRDAWTAAKWAENQIPFRKVKS